MLQILQTFGIHPIAGDLVVDKNVKTDDSGRDNLVISIYTYIISIASLRLICLEIRSCDISYQYDMHVLWRSVD